MKLSDLIKIWDLLWGIDVGDLKYDDLKRAIGSVVKIEDDLNDT